MAEIKGRKVDGVIKLYIFSKQCLVATTVNSTSSNDIYSSIIFRSECI